MGMTYFNEHDKFAAQWLRNLWPDATVDERDIQDVKPEDVMGFERVHFFGGIGGWEYALELAGWPEGAEVWTGSCPCQPLSCAGKRAGEKDERHLWPEFYRLISECRPAIVFGEQVDSKDGLEWLDGVSLDLEELDYAIGASDLPAASVRAPQRRQRFFWMADMQGGRCGQGPAVEARRGGRTESQGAGLGLADDCSGSNGLAVTSSQRVRGGRPAEDARPPRTGESEGPQWEWVRDDAGDDRNLGGVGDSDSTGLTISQQDELRGSGRRCEGRATEQPAWEQSLQQWRDVAVVSCRDGRTRRLSAKPGDEPLAYGIPTRNADPRLGWIIERLVGMGHSPKDARGILKRARANRVGRLKGYGNSIVPAVAAMFIKASMEAIQCTPSK